ncbi:polar amino acid transport system substrate-binding protein [Kibdelosporangium banguiense]|uniref:Polar amino acid transport system substrate-binding protein n=1 Tax=Kibdelosporangium banguiense TaxID=1365924 RepID=A0ABS4TSE5_9PSEU|nr:transporter substrate-binding domain-containing protein [Kibdelosporangium banguiense]MBP2326919.1 polar amino acid transport system substrate-binding protein [Kibdelosporangium banguiense]
MNRPTISRRPRALVAAVSLATLLSAVVGCSSSGSGSAASPSSSAGAAIQADPALAAMLPQSVKDKGYLDVASEIYPPAVIVAQQGAEPTGWDVETVRAIAATLGLKARFQIVPFDGIVPGLQAGRYQAAAGEIFITPERSAVVTFVKNHVTTDSLLVKKDRDISGATEDALCGLTVSVQLGSAEAKFADSIAAKCQSGGKAVMQVKTFQEQAAVNLAVSEGRADAALGSTSQIAYVVNQTKGKFKTVELPWGPTNATGIALARNADTDRLAKAIEAATNKLLQDGTIKKILDSYTGGLGAVDKAAIVPAPAS